MTDEKTEETPAEKVKVVFEDPKAEEGVPSTAAVAQEKYLNGEVDFDRKIDPGTTRPLEEDGFVGVDPEYRNYASVAGQPFRAEEGVDKMAEEYALGQAEDAESGDVEEEPDEDEGGVEPEPESPTETQSGGLESQLEPKSDTPAPSAGGSTQS